MHPLSLVIKNLPRGPGVYTMLDSADRVIYVGKAKDLKKRVSTYFQGKRRHSTRTASMVKNAVSVECIETDTELEAIILETNLIKKLRPKYNILMKDDKSYVYIAIKMDEDFPRIRVMRERDLAGAAEMNLTQPKGRGSRSTSSGLVGPERVLPKEGGRVSADVPQDKADRARGGNHGFPQKKWRLFGPKLASSHVYETLRILKKLFPFRHCNLDIAACGSAITTPNGAPKTDGSLTGPDSVKVTNRVIDFPCLDYSIRRCPGPCIGAVTPEEYKKIVQQITAFLSGKSEDLEQSLREQMMEAASKKLFEKAARLRDKLSALESITERQKISDPSREDTDVINFTAELGRIFFNIFMIRGGKIIGHENFVLDALEMDEKEAALDRSEMLASFITQYYAKTADIPKEILVPAEMEGKEALEYWLREKRGATVHIQVPQRGDKNRLLELSLKNALSFSKQYRVAWMAKQQKEEALEDLLQVLAPVLKPSPKSLRRIEGFDISHLGGKETVGSMVVFENGLPKSEHYRHFKLRLATGKPDDYRSMEEVLTRRLKYLQQHNRIRCAAARRKDGEIIKKWTGEEDWKKFTMAWNDKKPAGAARLIEIKPGIFMIDPLYISTEYHEGFFSYGFMQKLIARIKNKKARIYMNVEDHMRDHWMTFGFIEVKTVPDEIIKQQRDGCTIMAYYRAQKKKEDPSFSSRPDCIVVDGGKGQLAEAVKVLARLKLDIPVISLAKRLEEIFIPGQPAPILLEEGDEALKLLQRIRDESHRFAITFQREWHRKSMLE